MAKQDPRAQGASADTGGFGDFRDRAATAFDQLGENARDQIDHAPLIALAGGVALGALLAAVLPQPEQESRLLQGAGSKINGAGRDAYDRVRETARTKVDELAGDKVRDFFGLGEK